MYAPSRTCTLVPLYCAVSALRVIHVKFFVNFARHVSFLNVVFFFKKKITVDRGAKLSNKTSGNLVKMQLG